MATEEERAQQLKFQKKFIALPYLIFAFIICILFIVFPDITMLMTMFGLFLVYNIAVMFISFLKGYGRETLYTFILTLLVGAFFGVFIYIYLTMHH